MDIHDARIRSEAFGVGVVTEQTESTITIDFAGTVKKFLYPSSFATFLVAEDPAVQDQINSELAAAKDAEAQRQRTEKRREMIAATQQKSETRKGKGARKK